MKDEAAISAIKVQGDERSGLTWKGLFMDVDNTVNFYSTRDEVVANGDGSWKWPLTCSFRCINPDPRAHAREDFWYNMQL